MKLDQQIIDLIQSDDLDCIKLGLTYLKQDLDKCDISDEKTNRIKEFYYNAASQISTTEEIKRHFVYNIYADFSLIGYIHAELYSIIY